MTVRKFTDQSTLSYAILTNTWSPFVLPIAIWLFCWTIQGAISEFVGMSTKGGFSIIYLSRGAIFVSLLIFGYRAIFGLALGFALYFFLLADQDVFPSFGQFFLQNIAQTLIACFFIEVVKRVRGLNNLLDAVSLSEILFMMGASQLAGTIFKLSTATYSGDLSLLSVIFYQFAGALVGCLIVFYTTVYIFSILEKFRVERT